MPTGSSNPRFHIDYRLVGAGWAECDVTFGAVSVSLPDVSCLDDALGNLISAASMLLQGAGSARACFETEPGQYRWGFDHEGLDEHGGGGQLRVRIWWFDETCTTRPDERGEVLFDEIIPERVVHRAILRAADNVLNIHGAVTYHQQWTHPFPTAAVERVRRLFNERSSPAGD